MPLILGTNSIKDTGYDVDNSLRFNDGSSDYLSRSEGGGNRRTFTLSAWCKRSSTGSSNTIFSSGTDGEDYFFIDFSNNNRFRCLDIGSGSYQIRIETNRLIRDTSAWYHIVFAFDTTQGTASNRVKLYVNGVQETSFNVATYPSQNYDTNLNNSNTANIGRYVIESSRYYDGYLSEVAFIDGQQLDPTSFGEFDEDSGIWKPIDVSGLTFGTNGFYLDFENSGSLGADVSGNSNDFTVNNLTAVDQSTDTCTNNFTTWNPLAKFNNTLTFSEGNLKGIANSSSNPWFSARANIGFTSGKWFWETKFTGSTDPVPAYIGVVDESATFNINDAHNANGNTLYYNGSNGEMRVDGSSTSNDYGNFSTSDICGVAVNADDNLITIYKNGSAIITDYALSTTRTGFLFPTAAATNTSSGTNSNGLITNFGSPPYSESGGNSDGNGYGNFSMAVPSGYLSLCSANISEVLG
jgi:hypothetical protein